jgi:magnesium-dependent phosphatase 1
MQSGLRAAATSTPRLGRKTAMSAHVPTAATSAPRRRAPPTPRPLIVALDLDATVWVPEMYQLWGGAPFKRDPKTGRVTDRNGEHLKLMGAAPAILQSLAAARAGGQAAEQEEEQDEDEDDGDDDDDPVLSWRGWEATEVAYVSRTEHADWAEDALRAFSFPLDAEAPPSSPSAQRRRDRAREQRRAARDPLHGHGVPHLHALASHREIYPGSKVAHFRRIRERSGVEYGDMLFFDNERHNCVEVERLGVVSVHCPRGLTWAAWEEAVVKFAESKAAAAAAAGGGGGGSGARPRRKK